MNNLLSKLKEISSRIPLEQFDWEIPISCPLDIPADLSNYEKNLYLKDHFHHKMKSDSDFNSHYWSIQEWGGIGSFKRNDRNDQRIKKFIGELDKGRLTKDNFDCISSLSKVASFLNPDEFVIYDSRVIYSLNWLLFNYSDERSLFPQPSGRSAILSQYDMQTIFRLTSQDFEYRSHKNAYQEYCKLVKELSPQVYGNESKPYHLEMLLFLMAPTWVIEDIRSNVSIHIDTSR